MFPFCIPDVYRTTADPSLTIEAIMTHNDHSFIYKGIVVRISVSVLPPTGRSTYCSCSFYWSDEHLGGQRVFKAT